VQQQRRQTSWKSSKVCVPTTEVKRSNLQRWVKDRALKLPTKKGTLCLVVRFESEEHVEVGLFHDTRRSIPHDSPIEGLPTSVDV
jgi:hypothetical protein